MHFFVSHKSADAEVVAVARALLEEKKQQGYFSEDFVTGDKVPNKLRDAMLKCGACVVLWTKAIDESPGTRDILNFELGLAVATKRRVYMIKEKGSEPPFYVGQLTDYLTFSDLASFETHFRKVVSSHKHDPAALLFEQDVPASVPKKYQDLFRLLDEVAAKLDPTAHPEIQHAGSGDVWALASHLLGKLRGGEVIYAAEFRQAADAMERLLKKNSLTGVQAERAIYKRTHEELEKFASPRP